LKNQAEKAEEFRALHSRKKILVERLESVSLPVEVDRISLHFDFVRS
jgi:ribose 5-phosphate isomerase